MGYGARFVVYGGSVGTAVRGVRRFFRYGGSWVAVINYNNMNTYTHPIEFECCPIFSGAT